MLDERLIGTNSIVVVDEDKSYVFCLVKIPNTDIYYLKYETNPNLIKGLYIKPNINVHYAEERGKRFAPYPSPKCKALEVNIDPNIFKILAKCNLVTYSKQMADQYQLPKENAFNYGLDANGNKKIFRHRISGRMHQNIK